MNYKHPWPLVSVCAQAFLDEPSGADEGLTRLEQLGYRVVAVSHRDEEWQRVAEAVADYREGAKQEVVRLQAELAAVGEHLDDVTADFVSCEKLRMRVERELAGVRQEKIEEMNAAEELERELADKERHIQRQQEWLKTAQSNYESLQRELEEARQQLADRPTDITLWSANNATKNWRVAAESLEKMFKTAMEHRTALLEAIDQALTNRHPHSAAILREAADRIRGQEPPDGD